jgi:hypothetical protein
LNIDAGRPLRELFIYWHCERAQAGAAIAGLVAFQSELLVEFPGLQARRYLRMDDALPQATIMETYLDPVQALEPEVQDLLLARSAQALRPWCRGQRHVEVFERLGP